MIQLSPEESLLILTCRPSLAQDDHARLEKIIAKPLDWSFVLWRAETYQTLPLLGHHLQRLGSATAIPAFVHDYIKNWSLVSRARTIEQFRQLGQIINLLEQIGVNHFLLKGIALAPLVYPDPALRPMQDLDIMIPPRSAWKVQQAIYSLGYRHGVFDPQTGRFTHRFQRITRHSLLRTHALPSVTKSVRVPLPCSPELIPSSWRKRQLKSFVNSDGTITIPVFVDFHVNLSAGMELDDVWRGTAPKAVLGQKVAMQSSTALLWFSAARLYCEAFEHGTLKLQMFGDIDGILTNLTNEIDWAELLVIAQKYRLTPALYYVLSQARQLYGSPVPPNVLELLAPNQRELPAANDWGDPIPKLLSRAVVHRFEFAS